MCIWMLTRGTSTTLAGFLPSLFWRELLHLTQNIKYTNQPCPSIGIPPRRLCTGRPIAQKPIEAFPRFSAAGAASPDRLHQLSVAPLSCIAVPADAGAGSFTTLWAFDWPHSCPLRCCLGQTTGFPSPTAAPGYCRVPPRTSTQGPGRDPVSQGPEPQSSSESYPFSEGYQYQ